MSGAGSRTRGGAGPGKGDTPRKGDTSRQGDDKARRREERHARLSPALKANLRKRKAGRRARDESPSGHSGGDPQGA